MCIANRPEQYLLYFHCSSFWTLLTEDTPAATMLSNPCHRNPIQSQHKSINHLLHIILLLIFFQGNFWKKTVLFMSKLLQCCKYESWALRTRKYYMFMLYNNSEDPLSCVWYIVSIISAVGYKRNDTLTSLSFFFFTSLMENLNYNTITIIFKS